MATLLYDHPWTRTIVRLHITKPLTELKLLLTSSSRRQGFLLSLYLNPLIHPPSTHMGDHEASRDMGLTTEIVQDTSTGSKTCFPLVNNTNVSV